MADNRSQSRTESDDSVGEARPVSSDHAVSDKPPALPQFGPGSKVNWDNEKTDPNKRKHAGIDPEGKQNAKMFG